MNMETKCDQLRKTIHKLARKLANASGGTVRDIHRRYNGGKTSIEMDEHELMKKCIDIQEEIINIKSLSSVTK